MSLATLDAPAQSTSFTLPTSIRWLAVTLTILVLAALQTAFLHKPGELPVYLKAAQRMMVGEQIYRTDDGPSFSYPPFFALPFVPLAILPSRVADFVWNTANLLQAGAILYLLAAIVRPLERTPSPLAWWKGLALLLSARMFLSPLEYRSHDYTIALLLLGALLASTHRRDSLTGLLLGLATACKATPLLFLPMLMVQRRFKAAGCFVVAMIVFSFLPDLLFPSDTGRPWIVEWYQVFVSKVEATGPAVASGAWRAWNPLNQSLSGTLYRLTSPCETPEFASYNLAPWPLDATVKRVITIVALASIYATSLFCCWHAGRRRAGNHHWKDAAIWSLLSAEMLLLSPMTSKTHFAPLILSITLAVLVCAQSFRREWLLIGGLTLFFFIGSCLAKDIVGRHVGTWALVAGSFTWCALTCWVMSVSLVLRDDLAPDRTRSGTHSPTLPCPLASPSPLPERASHGV